MKRFVIMLACLLLLAANARAAVSVRMEDTAALLDGDGAVLAAPGIYDDIVSIGGGWFAAEQDGMFALMNAGGLCITEAAYDDLRFEGGLILAKRDGSWGILNDDGSARCGFEYSLILPGQSMNCWALRDDPNDLDSDKLYRIDPEGRQHATRLYLRAMSRTPTEGLLSVCLRGESLYGYCDVLGRMVIPAAYEYAGDFVNGLAAVVVDGCYGAIDRSGAIVIPAKYDFLEISASGLVIASQTGVGADVYAADGSLMDSFGGGDVHIALVGSGYAVIDSQFLYVYDQTGAPVLEAPPDSLVMEGVGEQLIISDGMWGEQCVYLSGTRTRYQNLYPLGTAGEEDVYARMEANVGRYMNDLLGELQLSTDMDSARYGVVNGRGEPLTDCIYLSLDYLGDDRLLARTKDAWQMIDARGRVLWQYDAPMQIAEPSSEAGF